MAPTKALWFLLFLWCALAIAGARPARLTFEEHRAKFRERAAARSSALKRYDSQRGMVFYPIAHGADPTGILDSDQGFARTVELVVKAQQGRELLPGISDLAGVEIDLQGGNFKLNKPLRLPAHIGNLVIRGGTLGAGKDFPTDRYLLELSANGKENATAMNYEDITLHDLLFDSTYRGGGLLIRDSARTRIDNCFFIHFTTDGILVEGGHETFISSSFLGQHITVGGDPHERNFTGTAIHLAGNDNTVTDVAIFSAAVGVMVAGQANLIDGVHCYNKATFFGGVGIYVKLPGYSLTRVVNSYLDYTGIVLEDPVQVIVSNCFFLGDAGVLLRSVKGYVSGLNIVDNSFVGQGWKKAIVELDERNGSFNKVEQVVVERNHAYEMKVKATVGKKTVGGKGKQWAADFGSMLVFPDRIKHVQYSLFVRGGGVLPSHAVTEVAKNRVVVEASEELDGIVTIEVDQNLIPAENNAF